MFSIDPSIAADILGDRLPSRVARSYRRFRHGAGAFKVDFAIEEGVPWTAPAARHAGTVHLGGDLDEVAANEEAIHRGAMPERPFVLVGQQYLADPTRSVGNIHPVWTYAHVPHAYAGVPGTYLCSASTPPGAGAHGMCGANAAARALAEFRADAP